MAIKVLIVDDSAFMRKIISDILKDDNDIDVIGTARNGREALQKIEELSPDVITLDVEMPIMDGISTLDIITKKYKALPVIMLSSLTLHGADLTLKALELGAVDFITKPSSIFKIDALDKKLEIIKKVKMASNTTLINCNEIIGNRKIVISKNNKVESNSEVSNIIAIGTSTGGPKALQSVIPILPASLNGSIVVVQHMPPGFTKSLADRLDGISDFTVKEAENNEFLKRGYCYIAPGDHHMTIHEISRNKFQIRLNKNKQVSGHRPSVDVLMKSVAKIESAKIIGVILTGMGSDGANGIKIIHDTNGYTIAQNEDSCVVYGMPKSAVKNNAIKTILPLNKIANEIINNLGV